MNNTLDLIHNILSFNIQKPERKKLLEDITDFYKSREMMYYVYKVAARSFTDGTDEDQLDWILYDLYSFYNSDVDFLQRNTRVGNKIYKILSRHYMLDTNEKITKLLNKYKSLNYIGNYQNKQINYFLGLLTPDERFDFILEKYFW
jgi:hypothetical protein